MKGHLYSLREQIQERQLQRLLQKRIIKEIPANKLLAETDGPTALQWVNGVYGMPDEIKNVYENICTIKKLDIEEFKLNSQITMTNIIKNK